MIIGNANQGYTLRGPYPPHQIYIYRHLHRSAAKGGELAWEELELNLDNAYCTKDHDAFAIAIHRYLHQGLCLNPTH